MFIQVAETLCRPMMTETSVSGEFHAVSEPPFNRNDADIIFRSSDGMEFRLHKQTLIMSSHILEKMVRESESASAEKPPSTIQTLEIPEQSAVLDLLFRYCYPVVDPKPKTLETVRDVIDAATKYAIPAALEPLTDHLLTYLADQPVRVYIIARRNNLASLFVDARCYRSMIKGESKVYYIEIKLVAFCRI